MATSSVAAPPVRRVYIQLRDGNNPDAFETQTAQMARLGRVDARGTTPETDVTGSWFEVYLRSPVKDIARLRQRLERVGVRQSQVHSVHIVTRAGDGRTFAKQLDLFGRLAP